MSVPKKRKRKAPTMSAPRRRRVTRTKATAPRRRRRMSASGSTSLMAIGTNAVKGGIGGALHEVPRFFTKLSTPMQIGFDILGTFALAKFAKQSAASAGFAGAAVSRHMDEMFSKSLKDDGDLNDYEYIDPNSLSDSGFDDDYGDPVMMDDDGNMYALSESGEDYEDVGHIDDFRRGTDLENVSMLNLQEGGDPYSLQQGNPYALSHGHGY